MDFHNKISKIVKTSLLAAPMFGCSSVIVPATITSDSPAAVAWEVTLLENLNATKCTLTSSAYTYSTIAGTDAATLTVTENNLVAIKTTFEEFTHATLNAVAIHVDNHTPISGPKLTERPTELLFDEEKSALLLKQFSEGKIAYVKLALPTQSSPISARFFLKEFHQALIKLRMCNLFTQSSKS